MTYPRNVSVHPSRVGLMGLVPNYDPMTGSSSFTAVANNEQEERELQLPDRRTALLKKLSAEHPGTIPPQRKEPPRVTTEPLYPQHASDDHSRSSLVQEPDQLKRLVMLVEGWASRA